MSLPEKIDDEVTPRKTFIDDLKSTLKDIVDEQILSDNSDQSRRNIPEYPFIALHQVQQKKQLTEDKKELNLARFVFKDIAYLSLSKRLEAEETSKDIILLSLEKTADFIKRCRDKSKEYESQNAYNYYIGYKPDILKIDNTDKNNPNIIVMYEVKISRYKESWENSISRATWLQKKLPEIFGETDLFYVAPQERVVDLSGFLDEEKIIPVPIKIKALYEFAKKML